MVTNKEIGPILDRVMEGTIHDPEIGPIDGTIQDAAYQISRGTRPLALLGHVPPDPWTMLRAYNRLTFLGAHNRSGGHEPVPLVVLRKDGSCADAGFAARAWVVETFQWISENIPQPHLDRLLGLMLGYSPDAIAAHDEASSGLLVPDTISALDEQESRLPHEPEAHCTAETSHPHSVQSPSCGYTDPGKSPTAGRSVPC